MRKSEGGVTLRRLARGASLEGAAKKLRCRLGFHRWVRHLNDEGKTFRRCKDCQKFRDMPDVTYMSGVG